VGGGVNAKGGGGGEGEEGEEEEEEGEGEEEEEEEGEGEEEEEGGGGGGGGGGGARRGMGMGFAASPRRTRVPSISGLAGSAPITGRSEPELSPLVETSANSLELADALPETSSEPPRLALM
jgi:hypothetical protein